MSNDDSHTNHLSVVFSGLNPETFDRADEPTADADGHVISGNVLKHPNDTPSMVPVRVRVGHGVSPNTAATMLRKIADMIENNPTFTSDRAGSAIRLLPDGTYARKLLTAESMIAAAQQMPKEDRNRFMRILDQIRIQIDDPKEENTGPSDSDMML